MTEYTDDTKTFTITLTPAATPTPTPTTSVTPQWIADNYDNNGSRRIDSVEMQIATVDRNAGKITQAQYDAVLEVWRRSTLLPVKQTTPSAPTQQPAKGELRNVAYPASAVAGSSIQISCRVKNIGTGSGTFKITASGGMMGYSSTHFNLGAGATSPVKYITLRAPSSGTSVTYTLNCIRIA